MERKYGVVKVQNRLLKKENESLKNRVFSSEQVNVQKTSNLEVSFHFNLFSKNFKSLLRNSLLRKIKSTNWSMKTLS